MSTTSPEEPAPGTSEVERPGGCDAQRLDELEREVATLRDQRDAAWMQLGAMRRSASWRLTWPLRRLGRLGRRR